MELTIDSKRKQIHIQLFCCCCNQQNKLNIFRNLFSSSHVSVTNRPYLTIALFSDSANIQSYNGTVKAMLRLVLAFTTVSTSQLSGVSQPVGANDHHSTCSPFACFISGFQQTESMEKPSVK